jgi:hypothetical protein
MGKPTGFLPLPFDSYSVQQCFADIADVLTRLLKEFGPSRTQHHPELPFWTSGRI